MKSAYELAMERLNQSAPQARLTDEQKAGIAEIDNRFKAKIAEREVFLKDLLNKARAEGRWDEVEELQQQLGREITRLNNEMEEAKEQVRQQAAG